MSNVIMGRVRYPMFSDKKMTCDKCKEEFPPEQSLTHVLHDGKHKNYCNGCFDSVRKSGAVFVKRDS